MITPAINLAGRCEEAIHYYERIFSTKADFILRYGDADPEDWKAPLTEGQKKYVYHAEMSIRGQRFMFSDIVDFPIVPGNGAFFVATFDTREEVEAIYAAMLPGSEVLVPLHGATYSSAVANLVDRFGVRWGLMTEQAER
jgi:PhnB protein